jgi:hypothetical protein
MYKHSMFYMIQSSPFIIIRLSPAHLFVYEPNFRKNALTVSHLFTAHTLINTIKKSRT